MPIDPKSIAPIMHPERIALEEKLEAWRESDQSRLQASKRATEGHGSPVDHPSHYGGADATYEVIKVIEAWQFPEPIAFHLGNAIKYIARAGRKTKDPIEDLEKARWYVNRAIQVMYLTDEVQRSPQSAGPSTSIGDLSMEPGAESDMGKPCDYCGDPISTWTAVRTQRRGFEQLFCSYQCGDASLKGEDPGGE